MLCFQCINQRNVPTPEVLASVTMVVVIVTFGVPLVLLPLLPLPDVPAAAALAAFATFRFSVPAEVKANDIY